MQLPKDFIERTKPLLGDEWNDFTESLNSESPTTIRVNSSKISTQLKWDKVPWCSSAYYLPERPQFTFDPLFHAGAYYVQEASSMIIEQAVRQLVDKSINCLDLCAAPGGKSTLLSGALPLGSLLVSNELIKSRANVLSENMMKWGNPSHIVTNNKPEDFERLKDFFDVILVDAPCSGEGMFRKDPQAIEEWSVANVKLCDQRQKDILSAIWGSLKPGGYLFYSTCTYNREENEEIVEWLCDNFGAEIVELEVEDNWGISKSQVKDKDTYHFFPHRVKGEGLYFAVLQKGYIENWQPKRFSSKKSKKKNKSSNVLDYREYINDIKSLTLDYFKDFVYAFPKEKEEEFLLIQNQLSMISGGICLGQIKGKDFIPHQSLALSKSLNKEVFNVVDIDWRTAIAYLRTETIHLPDAPKGIVLLTYKDMPLGFAKNLGNRANNLYPNEWRIRSANLPEYPVEVLF